MYINKKLYKYFIILNILFFIYFCTSSTNAQENFLLTEQEMPNFELSDQKVSYWRIDDNYKNKKVIEQIWKQNSNKYYIDYAEFKNEFEALKYTAYSATKSNSTPYIWGSLTGSIIKDASWLAIEGGAIYFVRGNIGIKLFKPLEFDNNDKQILIDITTKLLTKINSNISSNILDFEQTLKQKQIPKVDYQKITDPVVNSTSMHDFEQYTIWDSKWLTSAQNIVMGIRYEWKNEDRSIVSIDICNYESEVLAQDAIELRANSIPTSYIYNLDNLDSLKSIIMKFKENKYKKTSHFMLGIQKNITIHYYHFDPDSIKWDLFSLLSERLSEQIINF